MAHQLVNAAADRRQKRPDPGFSLASLKLRLAALDKRTLADIAVALFEMLLETHTAGSSASGTEHKLSQLRRHVELHPERLPALAAEFAESVHHPIVSSENPDGARKSELAEMLSELDAAISSASRISRRLLTSMAAQSPDPADAGVGVEIPPANVEPGPDTARNQAVGTASPPQFPAVDNDPLTGLQGRPAAQEMLERTVGSPTCHIAVFVLDRLKIITEKYGPRAGDQVLSFFSQHLAQQITAANSLFRWGPAAFVVIFTEPLTRQQVFDQVRDVALAKVLKSLELQHRSVLVQITTQWKLIGGPHSTVEALYKEIDQFVATPHQTRSNQD